MNDEKIIAIAERLLEKSEKGEVAWSDTAVQNNFAVDFPDYSISLHLDMIYGNYTLKVHNERGSIVQSLGASRDEEAYSTLAALFESAKGTALKADELLDNILERLSGD